MLAHVAEFTVEAIPRQRGHVRLSRRFLSASWQLDLRKEKQKQPDTLTREPWRADPLGPIAVGVVRLQMVGVRSVPVGVVVANCERQDIVLRLLPLRQRLAPSVQGLKNRVAVLVTIQLDVDDLKPKENGLGERVGAFVASVFGNTGDPFRDRVPEVAIAVVKRQRVALWGVGVPNRRVDNLGKPA